MFNSVRVRLTGGTQRCWLASLCFSPLLHISFCVKTLVAVWMAPLQRLADSFLATVNAEAKEQPDPRSLPDALATGIAEHRLADTIFIALDSHGQILASSDEQSPGLKRQRCWRILADCTPWDTATTVLTSEFSRLPASS